MLFCNGIYLAVIHSEWFGQSISGRYIVVTYVMLVDMSEFTIVVTTLRQCCWT